MTEPVGVERSGRSYALLADGTTLTIRPAAREDYEPVRRLHEAMSPDNLYFRFFTASRMSAEYEARRVCAEGKPGLVALLGLVGGELAGVASYELTADGAAAEVALAVADDKHRRGIATLLLEHLVSLARARGVKAFVAEVLPDNYAVLHVLRDSGLAMRRKLGSGVVELSMPVPRLAALGEASPYLDAVAGRDSRADVASLEPLLNPRSVAVVGAGRGSGSVSRAILLNIRDAAFAGALYAVGLGGDIEGVPCVPSVGALPEAPDLALVAVPAAHVVEVARECGKRGVRALAVITAGLTSAQESGLLAATRQGGMRLAGPASYGIAVPGIGLAATPAARHPSAGRTGLVVQSGGVGAALMEQLSRLGIGISSFAAVGGKLDVSSTDLLLWWEADNTTELALLHVESFGNPRRFARTARRVGAKIPILTVHAGRSAPGQRAVASHTAAAAAPMITRQALFEQAGIIAAASFGELLETAALMASQPVPAGSVVAIVSSGGGAGMLAAEACADAGLTVATTGQETRNLLREVLPAGASLGGPVDTTAAVGPEAFREALRIAAAQDGVHAVIAVVVRSASPGLLPVLTGTPLPVPAAAVVLDQPEAVNLLDGTGGNRAVPGYAYPEAAARALARAARYGAWRSRPAGTVPDFADLQAADARSVITAFLARMPGGGWLSAEEADHLLRCYGIPMVSFSRAGDADAATAAAAGFGGHVVIKADVPGVLHKTAAGAVELDLHGEDEVRAAMRRLQDKFAGRLSGVLVEPMITGGIEAIVGVVAEPVFGPVVVFGLGGVATEVLGDHAARLVPSTSADADELIRSIRAAPVLLGHGGQPPADIGALRDTLLRVSRLADDLPEVAELDLNPVIVRPDGVVAVDARIRVTSHRLADPFLRQLPR
ncbi:MAG TPA: GNAT family N-acetyltransferase [Streptosporangiaceae bacterium]|jgi:acyl-CoA synthetase (NDP forming)/GNAT superfamily N-acetyltransferase